MDKVVLFVCTGNTCRSPMAEAWFNKRAAESGLTGYIGASAGVGAVDGASASWQSVAAIEAAGGTLTGFRARCLTLPMVNDAAYIVGMTDAHCRVILSAVPQAAEKTFRLLDFVEGGQVSDPYGGSEAEYRQCLNTMQQAIENIITELKDKNTLTK